MPRHSRFALGIIAALSVIAGLALEPWRSRAGVSDGQVAASSPSVGHAEFPPTANLAGQGQTEPVHSSFPRPQSTPPSDSQDGLLPEWIGLLLACESSGAAQGGQITMTAHDLAELLTATAGGGQSNACLAAFLRSRLTADVVLSLPPELVAELLRLLSDDWRFLLDLLSTLASDDLENLYLRWLAAAIVPSERLPVVLKELVKWGSSAAVGSGVILAAELIQAEADSVQEQFDDVAAVGVSVRLSTAVSRDAAHADVVAWMLSHELSSTDKRGMQRERLLLLTLQQLAKLEPGGAAAQGLETYVTALERELWAATAEGLEDAVWKLDIAGHFLEALPNPEYWVAQYAVLGAHEDERVRNASIPGLASLMRIGDEATIPVCREAMMHIAEVSGHSTRMEALLALRQTDPDYKNTLQTLLDRSVDDASKRLIRRVMAIPIKRQTR